MVLCANIRAECHTSLPLSLSTHPPWSRPRPSGCWPAAVTPWEGLLNGGRVLGLLVVVVGDTAWVWQVVAEAGGEAAGYAANDGDEGS